MKFTPRLTRPEAGNKYYIRKAQGGFSPAIKGKPTDKDCNVLHNCVGYAIGRFNEIGGYGCCKYLRSVNAENFIQYKDPELEVGQIPKLGAVAVWKKGATLNGSDGMGHVAIVEQILSPTKIVTSESGYGAKKPFWIQTREKGAGNWGQNSAYTFLGFIYNPAVEDTDPTPDIPDTAVNTSGDFKIGDIVDFIGNKHYSNAKALKGADCFPGKARIADIYGAGKHAYLLIAVSGGGSTVYGWCDLKDIKTLPDITIKVGDAVKIEANAPVYGKSYTFSDWVYKSVLYVREISGKRAVISTQRSGKTTGAVDIKYLIKRG